MIKANYESLFQYNPYFESRENIVSKHITQIKDKVKQSLFSKRRTKISTKENVSQFVIVH